jgi:hypothetical protein
MIERTNRGRFSPEPPRESHTPKTSEVGASVQSGAALPLLRKDSKAFAISPASVDVLGNVGLALRLSILLLPLPAARLLQDDLDLRDEARKRVLGLPVRSLLE